MESALSVGSDDPDLRLIETLGWTGGDFPRLDLHLARLTMSAQRLGWPCDAARVRAALTEAAPQDPARMRLTLDATGTVAVQVAPPPPPKPRWTVTLAAQRLASDDPWLALKSTRRTAYEAARATLPAGIDEAILPNERGEVCDGSITTVFFDRGHGMRTPPLTCGVLPGVLRAELALPEEVLLAKDLPDVQLWVGNSLRGLVPCSFILAQILPPEAPTPAG